VLLQAILQDSPSPALIERDFRRYASTSKVRLKFDWDIERREKASSSRTSWQPRASTCCPSCTEIRLTFLAVRFKPDSLVRRLLAFSSYQ